MRIRPMKLQDYEAVVALWKRAGLPFEPQGRDSRASIKRQIQKSGHLMLIAESDKKIIGTVFGSHDGRKGWINRLAIDPEFRRRGLAKRLIHKVEQTFYKEGIYIVAALIEEPNEPSMALFKELGYVERGEIIYFRKDLRLDISPASD